MAKMTKNKRWTDTLVTYLRNNYYKKTVFELSSILDRSETSIRWKAQQIGLKKYRKWSQKETNLLLFYVGHLHLDQISETLDRSIPSIKCKLNELGTTQSRGKYSLREISRITKYDRRTIIAAKKKIGQKWARVGTKYYRITYEQLYELLAVLGSPAKFVTKSGNEADLWAPNLGLSCCAGCETSGNENAEKHKQYGLCRSCFWSLFGKNLNVIRFETMKMYVDILLRNGHKILHHEHPFTQIRNMSLKVNLENLRKIITQL